MVETCLHKLQIEGGIPETRRPRIDKLVEKEHLPTYHYRIGLGKESQLPERMQDEQLLWM